MKKKILIIPSWYPTEERPLEGTFFQEQALAMKQLYDVKIFYPKQIENNRLLRLCNVLLYFLRIKLAIKFDKDNYANNPEKFLFYYTGNIGRLNFESKMLEWQCNAAFEKIIETGWVPDLIHAQCTTFGGIISYFISKKYRLPYIITEHNVFLLHSLSKKRKSLIKTALENAKIVLSVSEHQKRMILMHNINCNPVTVGNMVDENIFTIAPKKCNAFTILYISFDHYIKDNETFIKAIKMFHQKSKEPFTVKILGRHLASGKPNPFFVFLKKYDLQNCIDIIDYVERDKVVNYFQNSDVLVSTSIAETFGLGLCEALFCGIPIISTANGGVDDMINAINGIKVNIKDEAAVCDALLKIQRKEIVFDQQEIRKSVISKFSKEVFIKKIDEIYSSALKGTTELSPKI